MQAFLPESPAQDQQVSTHPRQSEEAYDTEFLDRMVITPPFLGNLMNTYASV